MIYGPLLSARVAAAVNYRATTWGKTDGPQSLLSSNYRVIRQGGSEISG
jgi:hypothetical protein